MLSPEIQCTVPMEESDEIKFKFTALVLNLQKIQCSALTEESCPVNIQFKEFVQSQPKISVHFPAPALPEETYKRKISVYDNVAKSSKHPVHNTSRGKFISQSSV